MKKLLLLTLSLMLYLGAHAIDKTSKDYQKDLEKQLGYKLPKLKEGKYKAIEHGHIPVYIKNKGIYFCDLHGVQVSPVYKDVMDEANGFYPVQIGNKWGFIDVDLKEAIPCMYSNVGETIANGIAPVDVGSNVWALVNIAGETVQAGFDDAPEWDAKFDCWKCHDEGGWGIADKDGKIVVPLAFASLHSYDGEIAVVAQKEGNLMVFNCSTQDIVTSDSFSDYLPGKNGVVALKDQESEKWGVVNKDGEEIVPFVFENEEHVAPLLAHYSENPTNTLTETEFQRLSRQGHPKRNSYKIDETIPNDVWNY